MNHLDGVMEWVNDPDVSFYFARGQDPITREEEARFLRDLVDSKADLTWSIFDGDEYLGQIGLNKIYWPARTARLGINLKRSAWGKGIAKEAARLCFQKAFLTHNLNKIWIIIRVGNGKGLNLWTQVGFRCEGILREEYYSRGQFHDMVRMAMLKSDWDTLYG